MWNLFKSKKKVEKPALQHIAFPVDEFDKLTSAEKRKNHEQVINDGWKFTVRAFSWMIMSRESSAAMPDHSDGMYGVNNARPFAEAELQSLHFRLRASLTAKRGLSYQNRDRELEKTFEEFATTKGLNKERQQKILHMMRFRASRGQVVGYEDLEKYPFSMLGDAKSIFGIKLDDVVSFQNRVARFDVQ